ncbi:hypothetical protein B0J15DRAFT_476657 [Fusarium solani]|uniref:WSC domain-containing protein n=1 Tax=Fusarium solani TaxID=169388 RepID=A0A9P9RE20_FUSSL|nr:uncharacterized protein B0J15DRAFT_476657 [Fusarium solani]KAH7276186.1 hypothetical protein B0J15DRAFT_476657 [Fusarium solani]
MANCNTKTLLGLLAIATLADAYWRMSCSIIQTGRVDPIIAPGRVAAHLHKVSGASNFGVSATYDDLQASRCSSCEVQDDKSAYWTPQLFYQHSNGSFELVPNGGTVVYYLGRGENRSNIEPFPPGFKMLSGDSTARSADTKTMTYSKTGYKGRPVAERISFACLDSSGPSKERNFMWRTDCDNGMRAQVHFQSCWNGGDYQPDQSHVAYLSQIDNGICPPSHPRMLPHLFLEVIYGVNNIDKSKGGKFVFAQGDTTGYGFHGDFLNGWDMSVLKGAIKSCINNDAIGGAISKCPILASSQTPFFSDNCPEMPPIVNETVRGMLDQLPGCNQVTSGPAKAPQGICATQPPFNDLGDMGIGKWFNPSPGDNVGSWAYLGCAAEGVNARALNKYAVTSDIMTIEYCTAACKEQGYPLAGMENGRECYCASALTNGASYVKASICAAAPKMICSGNMTQYCGGPNLLTVWNDTSYTPPVQLVIGSTKIANGTATYQGCYAEATNGRALSSDRTADTVGMTNEMCVAFCQAGGYLYAGTEYSQECYCGNTIGGDNIPDISQCSMQCKGNIFSYCGAGNKLSVWKITQPEKPAGPITAFNGAAVYTGCYTDGGPGGRTLPGAVFTGSSVSLDTCFAFCKKLNFPLFGMEYGRECYCGYAPKTRSAIAPDGDCRMPCAGDASQKCGAGNRISIWNNTLYMPMASPESFNIQPHYLGCYTEGKQGLALGKAKTSDSKMTVEVCANYCANKNLAFMGLQNGQDCYCSNAGPSSGSVEAPEKECNVVCKGNKAQKCGAAERLNVYKVNAIKNSAKPVQAKVQDFSPTTLHKATTTSKAVNVKGKATTSSKVANVKAKSTTSKVVNAKAKATTTSKMVNAKARPTTTVRPAVKGKKLTSKAVVQKAKHTSTARVVVQAKKTSSSKVVNVKAKPTTSHRVAVKAKAQTTSKPVQVMAQAKSIARPTTTSKVVKVAAKKTTTAKVEVKKTTTSKAKSTSTLVRVAKKTRRAAEPEVTVAPIFKRRKGEDSDGGKKNNGGGDDKDKNKGKGKGKGKDDDDAGKRKTSTLISVTSSSSVTKTEDSRKGRETKHSDDRKESKGREDSKGKKTSTKSSSSSATATASVSKTEDHKKGRQTKAPEKGEKGKKGEKGEKGEQREKGLSSKDSRKSKTATTRPTPTGSTAAAQATKDSNKGKGHGDSDKSRNKKPSTKSRFRLVTRISGERRRSTGSGSTASSNDDAI